MKICLCIGKLSFSGAENVASFLMKSLLERGHEVSALLLEKMPSDKAMIEGLIIEPAFVKGSGVSNAWRRVCAERNALKKLAPDVFIIFNCEMAFSAIPASRIMHTKVIVCERNDPTAVPASSKRRKLRNTLYKFADAGVYQTNVIAKYFENITKQNFVIENPIRNKGVLCAPVAQRKKFFSTVARLDDKQKNQTMMIRGFVKATEDYPEYELHFLGDGPDLEKYKTLVAELHAENKVKFLGKHSAPLEYINQGRGFLLTSDFEGMPNALIEAMSVGLPCIATDCLGGGAAALVENGVNGILIDRNDEESLVNNIRRLIENDDLCDVLGMKAYEINDRLDPQKIVDEWENMCKTVVGKKVLL